MIETTARTATTADLDKLAEIAAREVARAQHRAIKACSLVIALGTVLGGKGLLTLEDVERVQEIAAQAEDDLLAEEAQHARSMLMESLGITIDGEIWEGAEQQRD